MRFSDWHDLDNTAGIPAETGLFQVRVKRALLAYPGGKTAMYYYGYAADLQQGCRQFIHEILPKLDITADGLLLRTMVTDDVAHKFQQLLQKFSLQFGALPHGNTAWLAILQQTRSIG